MKVKELLNKFEDVSYVLKDENGNEIGLEELSRGEECKLFESKKELLNAIMNQTKNSVDKLDGLE